MERLSTEASRLTTYSSTTKACRKVANLIVSSFQLLTWWSWFSSIIEEDDDIQIHSISKVVQKLYTHNYSSSNCNTVRLTLSFFGCSNSIRNILCQILQNERIWWMCQCRTITQEVMMMLHIVTHCFEGVRVLL